MNRKLDKVAMQQKMEQAHAAILEGATRAQAAAEVGLNERVFYKYYGRWQEANYEDLRKTFKSRVMGYLYRQDSLYKKAVQSERIGIAAQINDKTLERLQSIGLVPKASEKVEVTGKVDWVSVWKQMKEEDKK